MCHVCQVANPFLGVLRAIGGQVDAKCAAEMWMVYLGANSPTSVHSDHGSRFISGDAVSAADVVPDIGEVRGIGCCVGCDFTRLCDDLRASSGAGHSGQFPERVVGVEAGQDSLLELAGQQRGSGVQNSDLQQPCCSVRLPGAGVVTGVEEESSSGSASVGRTESFEDGEKNRSVGRGSDLGACGADCTVVAKNTLRNRSARQRRKQRKTVAPAIENFRSAFETCDPGVRKMLADTRAERLIEENKRAIADARNASEVRVDDKMSLRSAFALCDEETRKSLAESRAKRLILENEQAEEKARRQLEVMRASDIAKEIKQSQTRLNAAIECNMVSMEKAHATLVATGNVPGEVGGFAQTIVGSGSISPNSSASLQEFRACQKALLDSEARVERMAKAMNEAGIAIPYGPNTAKEMDHLDNLWTDNTENRQLWGELYSSYGIEENYCDSGKTRIVPV